MSPPPLLLSFPCRQTRSMIPHRRCCSSSVRSTSNRMLARLSTEPDRQLLIMPSTSLSRTLQHLSSSSASSDSFCRLSTTWGTSSNARTAPSRTPRVSSPSRGCMRRFASSSRRETLSSVSSRSEHTSFSAVLTSIMQLYVDLPAMRSCCTIRTTSMIAPPMLQGAEASPPSTEKMSWGSKCDMQQSFPSLPLHLPSPSLSLPLSSTPVSPHLPLMPLSCFLILLSYPPPALSSPPPLSSADSQHPAIFVLLRRSTGS
eukprot:750050-Hanusia_phi.AAC.3